MLYIQDIDQCKDSKNCGINVIVEVFLVRSDDSKEENTNCAHQLLDNVLLEPDTSVNIGGEYYCAQEEIEPSKVSTISCSICSIFEAALECIEEHLHTSTSLEKLSTTTKLPSQAL